MKVELVEIAGFAQPLPVEHFQGSGSGSIKLGQSIEVRDESGNVVHRLPFRDAVTISD